MTKGTYLLTADVGGTNSRMALYSSCNNDDEHIPKVVKFYSNEESLTAKEDGIFEKKVIIPFLQHCWASNEKLEAIENVEIIACLAIAGPVRNNAVWMSNLHNIVIDGNAIAKQFYVPHDPYLSKIKVCKIINDFVAQGYGCLTLAPSEIKELNPGSLEKVDATGPKVCVGAGTGLGECFLAPDAEGNYTCFPSEGGHVDWAPRNDLEVKLWKHLKEKFNYKHRLSVERIVSGKGLANVYEFLAQEFPDRVDKKVHEEFEKARDMQGKVVAVNSQEGTLCAQAMEIMMGAYGSECGSAAIKFIPTGGLYVTGGLTPKNIKWIEGLDSPFMKAYNDKGRVNSVLKNVPVFAVMTEDLGLRGAHKNAQLAYEQYRSDTSNETKQSEGGNSFSHIKVLLQAGLFASLGVAVGMALAKKTK